MKKVLLFLILILSLISMGGCSLSDSPIREVVEHLKLEDTKYLQNCSIKFLDGDYSAAATYYITPSGFEMEKLAERNYYMEITVSYNVYYKKDYDVLWDIGYAGSPRYEISISNEDGLGKMDEDLPTTTKKVKKTFSIKDYVADLKDMRLMLMFSTDNVQNIIYFTDIVVTYKCYKG